MDRLVHIATDGLHLSGHRGFLMVEKIQTHRLTEGLTVQKSRANRNRLVSQ